MGKKHNARRVPQIKEQALGGHSPTRGTRDWPPAIVAGAGMLLTAYLSFAAWSRTGLAYCDAGSGCDVVQSSRWSVFLGVPMAAWGFATYAALVCVALFVPKAARRTRASSLIATVGVAVSLYLAAVSVWVIEALCVYCLASLVLISITWLLTWRPFPGGRLRNWRAGSVVFASVVVLFMHVHYAGVFDPAAGPEDPSLRDLAIHLSANGAAFYGAYWCPHCQEQKTLFGAAAKRLPYVECTPHGRGAPRATECETQRIESYPTWVIGGRRLERLVRPQELARLTGFAQEPGAR